MIILLFPNLYSVTSIWQAGINHGDNIYTPETGTRQIKATVFREQVVKHLSVHHGISTETKGNNYSYLQYLAHNKCSKVNNDKYDSSFCVMKLMLIVVA